MTSKPHPPTGSTVKVSDAACAPTQPQAAPTIEDSLSWSEATLDPTSAQSEGGTAPHATLGSRGHLTLLLSYPLIAQVLAIHRCAVEGPRVTCACGNTQSAYSHRAARRYADEHVALEIVRRLVSPSTR